ncbi:putative protease YdeA [compost metagenome]
MKEVLIFITDGFADWEASYVSAELNKQETQYKVKTIAINEEPKISMGGLTVLPDYSLKTYSFETTFAMLIIPGGTGWRKEENQCAKVLVDFCFRNGIPVAAICDATTFLGNNGFLENNKHTGNSLPYLKEGAPNYRGDEKYVDAQSVSDGNLITANGTATLEFSKDILEKLEVLENNKLNDWYLLFKEGYFQA